MTRAKPFAVSIAAATLLLSPGRADALVDEFIEFLKELTADTTTHGLVVGIDAYDNGRDLNYASNDALAIADLLRELGVALPADQVLVRRSPGDAPIDAQRILNRFREVLRRAGSSDRVVFFFAGHGKEIQFATGESDAYLLTSDYDPNDIAGSALAFEDLLRTATRPGVEARQVLFLLDACYAATALGLRSGRSSEGHDALDHPYYRSLIEGKAVEAITAGDTGQQVKEKAGHGVFTAQLIRGLAGWADSDGNGVIPATELLTWLKPNVYVASDEYRQNVRAGHLVEGKGEALFLVPDKATRERLLSRLLRQDAGELDSELTKRRQGLVRSRGASPPPGGSTDCPAGATWDGARCVSVTVDCPKGSAWDGATCVGEVSSTTEMGPGCSDGSREGFRDPVRFPGIAGCGASWPMGSMRAAKTSDSPRCGNDAARCAVPADACEAGWHVCGLDPAGPWDLRLRLEKATCRLDVPGRFAAALGDNTCTECGTGGGAGAVCCGRDCVFQSGSCVWEQETPWFGMLDDHIHSCGEIEQRYNPNTIGVLCCRDPEKPAKVPPPSAPVLLMP